MSVASHGLSVDPPGGWHARIFRHADADAVLHLATFALAPSDGTFGAAATGRMGADDAFAALVAYRPDRHVVPGTGLFAAAGWRPRQHLGDFSPSQLQVTRPGHLGRQRFFTEDGRAFCLYAVIAPVRTRPARLLGALSGALARIQFAGETRTPR